jgi:hypothetical protein
MGKKYIRLAAVIVTLLIAIETNSNACGESNSINISTAQNNYQSARSEHIAYSKSVRLLMSGRAHVQVTSPKLEKIYNKVPLSASDQTFVKTVSGFYGINYATVFKLMYAESRFSVKDVSSTNDYGIMQINIAYYKAYVKANDKYDNIVAASGNNLFDFRTNVIIGCRELKYWKSQCSKREYYAESDYLDCYNRGFSYFDTLNKSYSDRVLGVNLNNL